MFIEWVDCRIEEIRNSNKTKIQVDRWNTNKHSLTYPTRYTSIKCFRNRKIENLSNLKEADLTFDKDDKMRLDRIMLSTANTPFFHQVCTTTDGLSFYSEVLLRHILTLENKLSVDFCSE